MPKPGYKQTMTEDAIRERQEASKVHGAYAFQKRGEAALETTGRTRLAELREIVKDRDGVLSLLQEKCADTVLIFELVQSYVAGQVKAGRPLDSIPAVRSLPAFANSMNRALNALIALMPDNSDAIDAASILEEVRRHKDDNQ